MSYKVTIYIPAFNAEKTIEHSIKSIQYQSLSFDEIIVVDDNSSDNTCEIIKKFHNIKLIQNSKIDYVHELIGSSFKITNPQASSSCGCGTSFSI